MVHRANREHDGCASRRRFGPPRQRASNAYFCGGVPLGMAEPLVVEAVDVAAVGQSNTQYQGL